jgi:UDP-glucose 4-epimerase
MRFLVTGGAGFIGSHLTERLVRDGHTVTVLDNFRRGNKLPRGIIQDVEVVEGDVQDASLVSRLSRWCDRVFHFAAVLGVDIVADNPTETMDTEVAGMRNVVRAALTAGCEKVVYASTSGIYGKVAIEHAVDEDFDVAPASSYAIAKRYNEIYLKSVFQETRLPSVSLRFFNVYGPRQDDRMVIPRFFDQAHRDAELTVYGDGRQTRDFTFVDDVVEATLRLADVSGGADIYNISNNSETAIGDLARQIVALVGRGRVTHVQPPGGRYDFEVSRRCGSSDKLYQATGFRPGTPLADGLAAIMASMPASGPA